MSAAEPVRELDEDVREQATYFCPVKLPEMGGDGWWVDVPEGEAVTLHWGNGDYGIHVTRNDGDKHFEVEVNVMYRHCINDAFENAAQVVREQITSDYGDCDIRMKMDVTYL